MMITGSINDKFNNQMLDVHVHWVYGMNLLPNIRWELHRTLRIIKVSRKPHEIDPNDPLQTPNSYQHERKELYNIIELG